MKVVILAGGLGTRLRDTIGDLPKPLAPVGDRPFLEHLVWFFSAQGFKDIILSCGYRADAIKAHFGDGADLGVTISYTMEKELLGTGGAIKLAETLMDSDSFIVANGDTYFKVDLNDMMRFHRATRAVASVALAYRGDTGRYGRVSFNEGGEIVSFTEKAESGGEGYINGGIYIFRRDVLDLIPVHKVCSLEREILPMLVGKGLYGYPVDGYFIDIGIPEDYERAKKELSLGRTI